MTRSIENPLLGRHMCPGSATTAQAGVLSRQNLVFDREGRTEEDGRLGPAWGFVDRASVVFIWNPRLSSCGRFTVDPLKTYGVSEYEAQLLANLNSGFI